ncbi:MAG: hypothetical protein QME49_05840 [bacterium]|nr:hypothetical protein [bacterium]
MKEAMEEYIAQDPSYQIFKEGLEHGRSYLSIPEWTNIVEKEITLNNLYRLWQDIRKDASQDELKSRLEVANNYLNWELYWKKILWLSIFLAITVCFLIACLFIRKLFLEKIRGKKENERLNLEIKTKEAEIESHKSVIQSHNTQIQWLTKEKEKLKQVFDEKKIEIDDYQSRITELELKLQEYYRKSDEEYQKTQELENRIKELKGKKYTVTIFYEEQDENESLLKYLLVHLQKVKIEVRDNYSCYFLDTKELDREKYENEKRWFIFLSYFSCEHKDGYVSPSTIILSDIKEGKSFRETIENIPKKTWKIETKGREIITYESTTRDLENNIKRWIKLLRDNIFLENIDILPYHRNGYRVNACIKFKNRFESTLQ